MKFPGVVAVLCVVPSGLVLHIGITSCTFPPWTEMSKKNNYEITMKRTHGQFESQTEFKNDIPLMNESVILTMDL